MGYELRRWLATRLPAGTTSGERLVALEIADQANDKTRTATRVKLPDVAERTGFANVKQVGKVLGKLAARGVELRVPVGKRVDGSPVFAYEGHQTEYRVPEEWELPAGVIPPQGEHLQAQEVPLQGPSGPPVGVEWSPRGVQEVPPQGEPSPHVSSKDTSDHPHAADAGNVAKLRTRLGANVDDDEANWIFQRIKDSSAEPIRSFVAYLRRVSDDDLNRYRAEYTDRDDALYDVPWCRKCNNPKNRKVQTESSYGEGIIWVRCPRCNPYRNVSARQAPPQRTPNRLRGHTTRPNGVEDPIYSDPDAMRFSPLDTRHVASADELRDWNPTP